jgi:hypothetical protein
MGVKIVVHHIFSVGGPKEAMVTRETYVSYLCVTMLSVCNYAICGLLCYLCVTMLSVDTEEAVPCQSLSLSYSATALRRKRCVDSEEQPHGKTSCEG